MEHVARGPGRPRRVPPSGADTREEILDTAAALFAAQGYAGTGTREIAAKVGLRQASLFHYFAHKDDLLAELLDRTVSPTLAATGWLERVAGDPHVRLYVLARADVTNLCCGPPQVGVLQLLPEARGPRFAVFWRERAELRDRYQRMIHEAARLGGVIDVPDEIATDLVFGAVESTMTWYDVGSALPPGEVAEAVASAVVRGILRRPPTPARLRAAGDRLLRAHALEPSANEPTTPRSRNAARAANSPHMPWTPPPGGVDAEHK
jgi:AcrR family transcriptional regulator